MKSRSVSIAWKILLVPNSFILIFGFIFTFFTDALLNMETIELFTGQSWSEIISVSPKIAEYILLWLRTLGVMTIVIAVYAFAIILMSFRRGERWSWYTLLIGTMGWIVHIVVTLILGEMANTTISVIMLLLVYIALAISAKDILSKKTASKPDV